MPKAPRPKIQKAGIITLLSGIAVLLFGILLFILATSSISIWIIIISVVINIAGITMLTYKAS